MNAPETWVPLFKKDGNTLFVVHPTFIGNDKEEARSIGIGAMLVECVLMKLEYTGTVRSIDLKNTPHVRAFVGDVSVAIIAGPAFDEYAVDEVPA